MREGPGNGYSNMLEGGTAVKLRSGIGSKSELEPLVWAWQLLSEFAGPFSVHVECVLVKSGSRSQAMGFRSQCKVDTVDSKIMHDPQYLGFGV